MKKILLLLLILLFLCALGGCGMGETTPEPLALRWAFGTDWPTAEDFYRELPEGASVSFAEDDPFPKNMMTKNYTVKLVYRSPGGKKTEQTATLNVTVDTAAPVISGVRVIAINIGEAVAYRDGVTVTDDCDGAITLTIDDSKVDTSTVGEYPVVYTATDRTGKTTTVETKVCVYDDRVTEEMLWEKLDPIIEDLGLHGMNKVTQIEEIWNYVHDRKNVRYEGTSRKGDWVRGAYDALEKKGGDCFTYYSLSKAFFERLGIENKDIFKPASDGKTNSHYWSMVNIGTADAPVWYYYDSTRVEDQSWEAYLLTDSQMTYLRSERPDLYDTDLSGYPKTGTRSYVAVE